MDLIRDTTLGQILRALTRNRILKYPEELPGFQCPVCYKGVEGQDPAADDEQHTITAAPGLADETKTNPEEAELSQENTDIGPTPETEETGVDDEKREDEEGLGVSRRPTAARRQSLARVATRTALQKAMTRTELERCFADACRMENCSDDDSIEAEKLVCGTIVVDWYSTDDPANPQNWSLRRKIFVSIIL